MRRSVDIDWRARLRCAERGKAGRENALSKARPAADDDELERELFSRGGRGWYTGSGASTNSSGATGVEAAAGGRRRIAGSDDDRGTERVCCAGIAPEHDV